MSPSAPLDIYAEIDVLPLRAVLALVCSELDAPEDDFATMTTAWDAPEQATELPPS